RGEERERRGELPREVVDADERPVDPDLLRGDSKLDRLAERLAGGVREPAARMPGAEREEADLLGADHRSTLSPLSTPRARRRPDDELPRSPASRLRRRFMAVPLSWVGADRDVERELGQAARTQAAAVVGRAEAGRRLPPGDQARR